MNAAARRAIHERDTRLAAHAREGLRRARTEPAYRAIVLDRLRPELAAEPDDLWTAIPWTWAVAAGGEPPHRGSLAGAVVEAAACLASFCEGDEPLEALESRWNTRRSAQLCLGSTLRSHPFPDLHTWSIRPMFAVSSSTPRGS